MEQRIFKITNQLYTEEVITTTQKNVEEDQRD